MDGLLSEISTTKKAVSSPLIIEVEDVQKYRRQDLKTLDDATSILRDAPDITALRSVLTFVDSSPDLAKAVRFPSARTTPFLAVLINDVIPNFWSQLSDGNDDLAAIIARILRSLPAISALVSRLKVLIKEAQDGPAVAKSAFLADRITSVIDILAVILATDDEISSLWLGLSETASPAQQELLKSEALQLFASGRIVAVISQAQEVAKSTGDSASNKWLGDGKMYSAWLARSSALLTIRLEEQGRLPDAKAAQLMLKGMSIGYADLFLKTFMSELARDDRRAMSIVINMVSDLRLHEQKSFFISLLRVLDLQLTNLNEEGQMQQQRIAELSAIIQKIIADNDDLSDCLLNMLIRSENALWMVSLSMRKAAILALSPDRVMLDSILEQASERFADDLFVAHCPVLHQEAITQVLLIAAGIVQREQSSRLRIYAKSARFMNSISLHLKSNSVRIRWLGMIVGSAVSSLIDDSEQRLKFEDDSLATSEAKEYLQLLNTDTTICKDIKLGFFFPSLPQPASFARPRVPQNLQIRQKPSPTRPRPSTKTLKASTLKIIELSDDDDLVPYAKPDSDPEDEEDDPTLVNRDKPKPPIYIRDVLVGLRETEDYDKHRIAFLTASSLIRRKSGFGKEVKDHIQELASILMNLNNTFDFEDFIQLREEALISVLVADPVPVAQYYAKSAFEGDFSIQQRTSLLAAMGLGARELAAFKDDERNDTPMFPSKELPDHLKRIYGEQETTLSRVAVRIQRTATEPLALKAADEMSGPNALKVRTFSSRIAKEKTRRRPAANELAKIVGEAFFFPLTARWWTHARASTQGAKSSPFASPILLPVYLRTLAIILHAAGSWALALPQMTAEFWSILLAVRGAALGAREYQVLEALLFGLLILLEVNNENSESIARERSRELLETQEWCKIVLSEIPGGDQESNQVRSLAASVIMRSQEVVERWQRLMVGNMIDF